jgi:hypothetical protein
MPLTVEDELRLDKDFEYHPPKGMQPARYREIRAHAKMFARVLLDNCPRSRELSLALTNLEQAVFWSNAAIARNENAVEKET